MLFNLCFSVNYCFQASCEDLHWKTNFSLRFYAQSWKMRKIQFLVTKSGQILNLMSGKVPRPQICGGFHLSESSSDGRNIPLEGGGETAFSPPPSLTRVNLKDFVSERILIGNLWVWDFMAPKHHKMWMNSRYDLWYLFRHIWATFSFICRW